MINTNEIASHTFTTHTTLTGKTMHLFEFANGWSARIFVTGAQTYEVTSVHPLGVPTCDWIRQVAADIPTRLNQIAAH